MEIMIECHAAEPLKPESWITTDPRFKWFMEGYRYASTQTMAIPTLSKVSPEDLYFAVYAVLRGAGLSEGVDARELADNENMADSSK